MYSSIFLNLFHRLCYVLREQESNGFETKMSVLEADKKKIDKEVRSIEIELDGAKTKVPHCNTDLRRRKSRLCLINSCHVFTMYV